MDEIIAIIKKWISERRTGKISINFYQGGIPNMNISESVKLNIKQKGGESEFLQKTNNKHK